MPGRTSLTHPLQIAEVLPKTSGRIGLTFCPGKKQGSSLTGQWDRDLGLDLDAVRAWGATIVVTLIEDHEVDALGVTALAAEVAARGMTWHHLPIRDGCVPTPAFEAAYDSVRDDLHRRLTEGKAVLVHCRGGLGRAGLLSARLLVETGHAPDEAIALVRRVRPGAIETEAQEDYVRAQGFRGS